MKQITFCLLVLLYFRLISPHNARQIVDKNKDNQEDLPVQATTREELTDPEETLSVTEVFEDDTLENVDAGITPAYSTEQPLTKERKQLLLTFFASIKNKFETLDF